MYLIRLSNWRCRKKVDTSGDLHLIVAAAGLTRCHISLGLPQSESDALVGGFIGQQK